MDKLSDFWAFVGKYKYYIAVIAFVLIEGFFVENSWVQRYKNKREIYLTNKEIEKYRAEYEESSKRLEELEANPEAIERIAREKYRMKKPNEDIYVFNN